MATPEGSAADQDGPIHVSGEGYDGYILKREPSDRTWVPTPAQIEQLEAKALESLRQAIAGNEFPEPPQPDLLQRLPAYTRQYWGEVVDGNKQIRVDFFCARALKRARGAAGEIPSVKGGGDCYVHAKVDPETGAFLDWWINARK